MTGVAWESMLTDIHLASKPVGLSMHLSKTKVMLNENVPTSTVAVHGNTIDNLYRYVDLENTVTQAGVYFLRSRGARGPTSCRAERLV